MKNVSDKVYNARASLLRDGERSSGPCCLLDNVHAYLVAIGHTDAAELITRKKVSREFKPFVALENALYTLNTGNE